MPELTRINELALSLRACRFNCLQLTVHTQFDRCMTTLGMPNKLMNMLSTLPRISSTDLNPELMEAHLKTFWRVNATLWLQFRIAHQTASSDHSCPSGSRQDPKEAEGRKEKRRREMIFNSRRAMASPILKDRMFLSLNLKTG
jgi:hypothetical protein